MNTGHQPLPKEENKAQQTTPGENKQEDVQVSLPHTDRPEGPFEHSGETAGWTKEEKEETEEKEQQQ